jgi:hypothetical protein
LDPITVFRQWRHVLKPGGSCFADYSPRKVSSHIGHHYSEEIEKKLPLNDDVPASKIERFFREAGFSEVSYTSEKKQTSHGKHELINEVFMFTCVKK